MPAEALNILPAEEQEFGRYKLLCRFATGGMANLYLARFISEIGFEKLVAIKRIHEHLSDNAEFFEMFADEARLCARLSHPNVVQVIELGSVGISHFIAMEYVEGESLSAVMRRTKPPIHLCSRVVADAAAGLHSAHELRDNEFRPLNVVHRDVSPQNILISYEGAVKVVDFGVARARSNLHQTTAGQVKGKFAYMSPEQLSGGKVDRRTDVFALGIVLYEITTAHRLFKGKNDAETVAKVQRQDITPPTVLKPDYPPRLQEIVMKALQRDPEHRFQTAEEMEDELEDFIIETGEPSTPRNLGHMMKEMFRDRIEMKQSFLSRCEETSNILNAPDGVAGTNPTMSLMGSASQAKARVMEEEEQAHRRRQLKILLIAGGTALAFLCAAVLVYFLKDKPSTTKVSKGSKVVTTGGDKRPGSSDKKDDEGDKGGEKQQLSQLIKVSITAKPAEAEILVDGKKVKNPYMLKRPAAPERKLKVQVKATDHTTKEFEVPLRESGSWMIFLEREPKPTADKAQPRKRPGRKRRRPKPKDDDDLFGDPYAN